MISTLLILLILDAYLYWGHVAMHKVPALWEIHKVHHSAYEPNFHLLEFMVLWLIPMTVSAICGYYTIGFVLAFLFTYEVSTTHRKTYKRSNRVHKMFFKPFKSWLGNAKYHKAHHDHLDKNLTQMFTFWDKVMGTEYREIKK